MSCNSWFYQYHHGNEREVYPTISHRKDREKDAGKTVIILFFILYSMSRLSLGRVTILGIVALSLFSVSAGSLYAL